MSDKDTTIFGTDQGQTAAPATTATQSAIDPKDPLALLVGQGRKYSTIEELAKAYVHIDGFAEQLKDENSKLREEVSKARTIDEVLEQLKAATPAKADQPAPSVKTLGAEDVATIVKQTLTGMETARTRESNLLKADAAMRKLYGDKAGEVFSKEASSPEMKKALVELASVSPDKFVALFAAAPPTQSAVDGTTSKNTTALDFASQSTRASDPTTKEYFEALRKKEPAKYYSQPVQLAMQKAAIANREHFFGRKA